MRLLLDANLSHHLCILPESDTRTVEHVRDIGLGTAADVEIVERAIEDGYVIVTFDADFSMLIALGGQDRPSVVQLRQIATMAVDEVAELLIRELDRVSDALESGAIVSLSGRRTSVRLLPVRRDHSDSD